MRVGHQLSMLDGRSTLLARHRRSLWLLLLLAAVGACRPSAVDPGGSRSTSTPPNTSTESAQADAALPSTAAPELVDLVKRLADADEERREAAIKELKDVGRRRVSIADGAFLLTAAADKYPVQKSGFSTQTDLIRAAASNPHHAYIPIVKEIFSALEASPKIRLSNPREAALQLLADINDEAGALALLDLLEAAVAAGSPPEFRLYKLEREPKLPEVYFPRMLESAKGPSAEGVFSLCLAYANEGLVGPARLSSHAGVLVDAYRPLRPTILAAQTKPANDCMCEQGYADAREDAGLLLDVMGYFSSPDIEAILNEASRLRDPKLAYFGAVSLLRLGRDVDVRVLEHVAESAEMRGSLFDELKRRGRMQLFPARWATQKALAESEMVKWLVYPTELGSEPDDLELMNVVSEDFGPPDGVMEWYLFRFRTHPPHWAAKDGWMAGVAGPFKRAEAPSTRAYGDTFSEFQSWNSKTPERHVTEIRELMARWRERRHRGDAE
jgi:hypothetical protein